jgi:hypothetical protein
MGASSGAVRGPSERDRSDRLKRLKRAKKTAPPVVMKLSAGILLAEG